MAWVCISTDCTIFQVSTHQAAASLQAASARQHNANSTLNDSHSCNVTAYNRCGVNTVVIIFHSRSPGGSSRRAGESSITNDHDAAGF